MAHPAIAEAAVNAVPDPKWGERPLACIAIKPGAEAGEQALHEHLLQHGFARWQLPDRYERLGGDPFVSSAGRYLDRIVFEDGRPKFREKTVVCDNFRVTTLLVTPI